MNASRSPHADPRRNPSAALTASYLRGPALTVLDGRGGALALDLASDDLHWLADACRRLLRGTVPLGASALKVRAAEKCYLVSRRPQSHEPEAAWNLTIANLYDSGESVTLASDLAEVLASMIDEAILRRERALIPAG
jgi:hypothetical protein